RVLFRSKTFFVALGKTIFFGSLDDLLHLLRRHALLGFRIREFHIFDGFTLPLQFFLLALALFFFGRRRHIAVVVDQRNAPRLILAHFFRRDAVRQFFFHRLTACVKSSGRHRRPGQFHRSQPCAVQ